MREYLIEMRKKRQETQQFVADRIGITRAYYQQIESGVRQKRMDIVLLTKMADHFRISITDIVQMEEAFRAKEEPNSGE